MERQQKKLVSANATVTAAFLTITTTSDEIETVPKISSQLCFGDFE